MTKKQRLSFYKELLKVVCEDPSVTRGFCRYITREMNQWYADNNLSYIWAYDPFEFSKRLPELYSMKPSFDAAPGYWFPTTKAGWQKRINLLHSVIVKMETSKK